MSRRIRGGGGSVEEESAGGDGVDPPHRPPAAHQRWGWRTFAGAFADLVLSFFALHLAVAAVLAYRLFFRPIGLPFPCTCILSLPCLFSSPTCFSRALLQRLFGDAPRGEADEAEIRRSLEEEKANRERLERELEEERSAAAFAAGEAMAMIQNLQKEKASLEIESRRLRRSAEEKSAFDEQEIEELKEILFRREREILALQREIEESDAYVDYEVADEMSNRPEDFDADLIQGSLHAGNKKMFSTQGAVGESSAGVFPVADRIESNVASQTGTIPYLSNSVSGMSDSDKVTVIDPVWGNLRLNLKGQKGLLDAEGAENDALVYDVHVVDDQAHLIFDEKDDEELKTSYQLQIAIAENADNDPATADSSELSASMFSPESAVTEQGEQSFADGMLSNVIQQKMNTVKIIKDGSENLRLASGRTYDLLQQSMDGNAHELKEIT